MIYDHIINSPFPIALQVVFISAGTQLATVGGDGLLKARPHGLSLSRTYRKPTERAYRGPIESVLRAYRGPVESPDSLSESQLKARPHSLSMSRAEPIEGLSGAYREPIEGLSGALVAYQSLVQSTHCFAAGRQFQIRTSISEINPTQPKLNRRCGRLRRRSAWAPSTSTRTRRDKAQPGGFRPQTRAPNRLN